MDFSILPECYVDTCLIETLVPPATHYNHQKGSGTVAKKMQENFGDRFALGIIDKDKRKLNYLDAFNLVVTKHQLELYKHKDPRRHHYLILIYPAVEVFMLDNAATVGLSLTDFGLPDTLDELRKVSKSVNSKHDKRFKELFTALIEQDAAAVQVLTRWIRYLKEQHYQADVEQLKLL